MTLYIEEEGAVILPFDVKETAELMVETVLELRGLPVRGRGEPSFLQMTKRFVS